ncbi:MAG: NADH-quinone oxidoreductase subunit J [Candidatus Bathyarchaeia archaeon]
MVDDMLQIGLLILTVLLALLTVELKDMLHAVISLCGMCISIGALFWLLRAPYVAVFQLLVYAGAVIVLFIAVVMLTTRKEGAIDEDRLG